MYRIAVPCLILLFTAACGGGNSPATVAPEGAEKSPETRALATGSKLLQEAPPLRRFDVYVVGFHPMKHDPSKQMEAHHYCHQTNEDFAQCALFDGNTEHANFNGIEYIISEKLFETLPAEERKYWHPHNYEILSGQLTAPGLPQAAEHELMKKKMNSYGKTWHVWMTGQGDKMPLGDAHLAWSFNRDGELRPELLQEWERRSGVNTADKRNSRQDLRELARPQSGVNELRGKFGRETRDIPGVAAK